jgi:hypothetical protein
MMGLYYWLYYSERSFKLGQPDMQGIGYGYTCIELVEVLMRRYCIPFVALAVVHYGDFPGGTTTVFRLCSLSMSGFVYSCR